MLYAIFTDYLDLSAEYGVGSGYKLFAAKNNK